MQVHAKCFINFMTVRHWVLIEFELNIWENTINFYTKTNEQ